ncbi:MAG: hypothetical protein A2268_08430 [Candidatus Raymondbacteria bacterium RifOxyA12_full_50_37]|uniref:Peptidase M20 dimerisation domain-containing protein n=1 Tax=Candidatus Raymondbacteria bacterium RIFOXYD12_FULL_49_13 TaxID=1817890 RepID=A0A1F7F473_UNCRA
MTLTPLQRKAVLLTQQLVRINTVNPPGNEWVCARFLGAMLKKAGFDVKYHEEIKGRTNVVALLKGNGARLPLCFSGHLDTVSLGATPWKNAPFTGKMSRGKILGRGSSDMKSGCAAMVVASCALAREKNRRSGLLLVLTADEEKSCHGSFYLAGHKGLLPKAGACIVCEPTANYPLIGHKGSLWLRCTTAGVTAHGSMPEKGVNAIYKATQAIERLRRFRFKHTHPVLGNCTLNVGTIRGGENTNSVPDTAEFTVDIRTVTTIDRIKLLLALKQCLGPEVTVKVITDVQGFASDPNDPWIQEVYATAGGMLKEKISPRAAVYFTDAAALKPALGNPPTIIWGPGEPDQAHTTNEFCRIDRIAKAVSAYDEIGRKWIREAPAQTHVAAQRI